MLLATALLLLAGPISAAEVINGFECPIDNAAVNLTATADLSQNQVSGTTYFLEPGEYRTSSTIALADFGSPQRLCYIGQGGSSAVVVKASSGNQFQLAGRNKGLGLKGLTLDGQSELGAVNRAVDITSPVSSQFFC